MLAIPTWRRWLLVCCLPAQALKASFGHQALELDEVALDMHIGGGKNKRTEDGEALAPLVKRKNLQRMFPPVPPDPNFVIGQPIEWDTFPNPDILAADGAPFQGDQGPKGIQDSGEEAGGEDASTSTRSLGSLGSLGSNSQGKALTDSRNVRWNVRQLRAAARRLPGGFGSLWVRGFSYEDTLAFRLHGPKPMACVIHPVVSGPGAGWGKPWPQILWDAEEALGLARANRWDIQPGPNGDPQGGWDHEALEAAEEQDMRRRLASGAFSAPEGWHLDRGDAESDDEYDIQEAAWKNGKVKQQWAETCILKVRHIDPNTFFGKGKIKELALYFAENPCDFVFVNTTLTPSQSRNLEMVFNNAVAASDAASRREEGRATPKGKCLPSVEVIDRNRLVLEIFHLRADSPQAKVQVGLARLEYLKTRLTLGTKARLRETLKILHEHVGPFREVTGFKNDVDVQHHYEVKPFETERVLLRIAENRLKRMLASEKRSKAMRRVNRDGVPTIGIVGYTNAGKTTLMNQLTDADFKERDLLFQTLDTVMRKVKLPSGGHAIIADSIGFIQHLPHNLFAAFQSTFEEIVNCDVLIHVRDISHPQRTMQKDIVLRTLRSAGMSEDKLQSAVIEVWNKIDLMKSMDFVPPE
ncbi:unnamed protein product, partial [Polarella glacialis]